MAYFRLEGREPSCPRQGTSGEIMERELRVLGEYVGHLVVGGVMFAALLTFGVALNLLVQSLQPLISDPSFLRLIRIVERVILYADVAFLIWWTAYSTYNAIVALHHE
jgi:hypothetical protein